MIINDHLNVAHVIDIHAAIVAAIEARKARTGLPNVAEEIAEALLIDLCQIIRDAPDDAIRAAMVNNAFAFIMRNCGADPARLMAIISTGARLANVTPEGTA